jgi:hypothetical protein
LADNGAIVVNLDDTEVAYCLSLRVAGTFTVKE